jgi:hypothetical protein
MSRGGSSEGGWVTTFADLMTLLFCFFVLINALSTQPKNCSDLDKFLNDNKEQFKKYELRSTKLSCIVSLPQDYLFRSGDAILKKGAILRQRNNATELCRSKFIFFELFLVVIQKFIKVTAIFRLSG